MFKHPFRFSIVFVLSIAAYWKIPQRLKHAFFATFAARLKSYSFTKPFMMPVLCSLFSVLCSLFSVLCSLFSVLCSLFSVLCSLFSVLCSLFCVLCSVFCVLCSVKKSLHVLNLLARFFDLCLHCQSELGNARPFSAHAARLRQQGVGLPVHLLQQEVELLAGFAAGVDQLAKVADVRGHARQLFRHIAALHQDSYLFQQPLLVELRASGRAQPLRQPLLVALLDLRP